ncbi:MULTISPECIES: hypothetical protein [Methylorubrum]|uniref:hypothetical protein n=1 Tax=Methylorubrum TaxID=2282523 RepID=UPI0020A16A64|nr:MULTISPECIES: hypothetical protein [Methylorubrum]MCP1550191.1 hypothetical protein [Methylorubrum zatmanii]MCP1553195.1 hypothetical protein [Methylorubrum extorquens]MCP1580493.1 hypothetical protein [Methylorubrum extorquens]
MDVDASSTAVDTQVDQPASALFDCSGMGGGKDCGPSEDMQEAGEPEDGIRFQTYHIDLLQLRDVTATMLPMPVAAEPDGKDVETRVPCEVTPDGLRFDFCNGSIRCQVRVPFAGGTNSSGAGRMQIPAQILRLAALQVVKNKSKPKKTSTRPQSSNRSLAPRAIYQSVPDEPAHWTMKSQTSDGRLLYGDTELNFFAPTDTGMPWEDNLELSDPIQIFPDRVSTALRAAKPAAATRIDALPKLSQVAIEDRIACASNQRMYAFHSDPALAGLSFRVAESDISKLTSLMRHLDPTATTFRSSGRTCVIQDPRLTIYLTQPFDTFPVINPRSSLQPTLAMQCEHAELSRLVDIALLTASANSDGQRRLQLKLRIALVDGQIALGMDAAWAANRFRNDCCSVMMDPEQASNLRGRLSRSSHILNLEREQAGEASAWHDPAPAIELGRYVVSDLRGALRSLRSGLLCLEFLEDKALLVSEAMAEHRTDYVLASGTQDDTHGLPPRRSKRWDAPLQPRT